MEILDNIKIVLVDTTHPGNIGATARAMKTMGMSKLELVSPRTFPSAEVTARAAGADDILAATRVHESLTDAIQDCELIYATSARSRSIPWPELTPTQAAGEICQRVAEGAKVAILFGRESSGLNNEELEYCNALLKIPTNPEFSSLNIASAVQIICYEIYNAIPRPGTSDQDEEPVQLADMAQMELFYEHLERCLIEINYLDPVKPRRLMRRLKRLFNRSRLDQNEYNIMRGILSAVQDKINKREK